MIKLALPVDGVRAGLLGGAPVCRDYMLGVKARARMLAKATRVKGARWQRIAAVVQPNQSTLNKNDTP